MRLDRRKFVASAAMTGATALSAVDAFADEGEVKVAAVQMHSSLGDVDANLEKAERWVKEAIKLGAKWVVLPEVFTTGFGRHKRMLDAHRPILGEPTKLLRRLAAEGVYIGGSFLAESNGDVYNTFVLATPAGQIFQHDKDFPSTPLESSYYAGGEDEEFVRELKTRIEVPESQPIPTRQENDADGVFDIDGESIACAICWEQIRYRTMRRIVAKQPDLMLTASCWPRLDAKYGESTMPEAEGDAWHRQVMEAPVRLAKSLGCPVVHANTCGDTWSLDGDLKSHYLARWLGESQIVDGHGKVLAKRPRSEGEGLVIKSVAMGNVGATLEIPSGEFWTPDTTETAKDFWYSNAGREYYLETTRPHRNR